MLAIGRLQEARQLLRPAAVARRLARRFPSPRIPGDGTGAPTRRDWRRPRGSARRRCATGRPSATAACAPGSAWRVQEAALDADLPTPTERRGRRQRSADQTTRRRRTPPSGRRRTRRGRRVQIRHRHRRGERRAGMIANAVAAHARWLLAQGPLDEATALVGRVAPWADRDFELALAASRARTRHLQQAPGDRPTGRARR